MKTNILVRAVAVACVLAVSAQAHVGLTPSAASRGVTMTFAFAIGHGCEGSPTVAVRMLIPDGVISVQPYAKPGWTIEVVNGAYAQPHLNGATNVTEGVVQINWIGGNLPSALYDEFLIRARVASDVAIGTTIWFPIVQECANGVNRWITVPIDGQPEPAQPTPGLRVIDSAVTAVVN